MSKYKVSVVTPFHNVDMKMFERAADSIFHQTIGFENIEWIIVVHNCEPHYMPTLTEMFGKYDNILLKELNNDARTPSSPRNHGNQFATAPYIGYLDGDDGYTYECLEKAVDALEKTGSKTASFRREFELEDEHLSPLTEVVLWNQTEELIVMERGKWDNEKMFNGVFGMVTSRLYDRQFLVDNDIHFDETVPFAEDVLFVLESTVKADKVCYLPQLIGYHYFINGGSLVQSQSKDGKTLITYAKGFAKIFDTFANYGIVSDAVPGLCMMEAVFIMNSPQLTVEERKTIRDILEPYINSYPPIPVNKINPPEQAEFKYRFPKEVILHPEAPEDNPFVKDNFDGKSKLLKILGDNQNTDFGKAHGFDQISTIPAYQFRVPVMEYKDYEPLIRLETNVGESGIFLKDPIDGYFKNAKNELLPVTKKYFMVYLNAFVGTVKGHHNFLVVASRRSGIHTNNGGLVYDLESKLVREYFLTYMEGLTQPDATFSSGIETYLFRQEKEAQMDILVDALLDPEIDQIVSLDTDHILQAFLAMEKETDAIIKKLEERNKERAGVVAPLLGKALKDGSIKEIWPSLQKIIAFGAGEHAPATKDLKQYTADIAFNHGYYYTEEAILGRAVEDNSDIFEIMEDENFYELLPIKGDGEAPIRLSEAETGEPYQLVVTTTAGLYRLITDHFIVIRERTFGKIRYTIY